MLAVITALVVISTCIIAALVYRHKQTKMIKDMFENPDKYTVNCTPEEKDEFMRKLQKRLRKNLRIDGDSDADAIIQFILQSAVDGLESDNNYKEEFIKAIRNHLADSNTVEHPKPEDPPQPGQDSTQANQGEAVYHPSIEFGEGEIIEMPPI